MSASNEPPRGPPAAPSHEALLHRGGDELVSTLVPWLREGREAGAALVVAATPEHIDLLRSALGADARWVSFHPSREWYRRPATTVAGWARVLREAAAGGRSSVRLVGELWSDGSDGEHARWTRYESALNRAFEAADAWIVCPYDVEVVPDRFVADVRRTHPILWEGERRRSDGYLEPASLFEEVPEPVPELAEPVFEETIGGDLVQLRAKIRRVSAEAGLSPEEIEGFVLASSEVVANALRHGAPPRSVTIWIQGLGIVCEVRDGGPDRVDALEGYGPPSPGTSGGVGLWIARQLTDWLVIDRGPGGGTRVLFGFAHTE